MTSEIKELKRYIRSSVTDKDLFTSKSFNRHIQNVADLVTQRYGNVAVKVQIDWNDQSDDVAYTDDRTIYINLNNKCFCGIYNVDDRYNCCVGELTHELGHIIYTDFPLAKRICGNMAAEELFKISDEMKVLYPWWEDVEAARKAFPEQFTDIFSKISNVVEDRYIEHEIVKFYSGSFKDCLKIKNDILFAKKDDETMRESEQNLFNCALYQIKVNNLSQRVYASMPRFNDALSIVNRINDAHTAADRSNITYEYIMCLWEYFKKYFNDNQDNDNQDNDNQDNDNQDNDNQDNDNQDNDNQDNDSSDNGSQNTDSPLSDDLKNAEQSSGKGTSTFSPLIDGGEDMTSSADEASAEKCQALCSQQDADCAVSFDRSVNEYINTLLSEPSQAEKAKRELERTDMRNIADNSIFHKHIDYEVIIPGNNVESGCYIEDITQAKKISKRMQEKIKRSVIEKQKGTRQSNLAFGRRLDCAAMCRGDGKMFSKSKLPDKNPDIAFSVVVDESGSMGSCVNDRTRIDYARLAALVLEDFCRSINIPLSLIGHTEDNATTKIFKYVDFNDRNQKQNQQRILSMKDRYNNRDGFVLRYAIEKISKFNSPQKVVIFISDGIPYASNGYHFEVGKSDIQDCLAYAKKKKIAVIAIAIGDEEQLAEIYGDRLVVINDMSELPQKLVAQIQKKL